MSSNTSIGQATMLPDGTLVLRLRAEGPNGILGDGEVVYHPNDKHYAEVKQHLERHGPMKVGEARPVEPFPD